MAAENGASGIISPAPEKTLHYVRLFFGQFTLTFGWHEALKAQKAHAEIERVRWWHVGGVTDEHDAETMKLRGGAPPDCYVVALTDDYGNTGAIDVRELKASMLSSGQASTDLHYAMQFEDLKGKQRYTERLENDRGLYAWMRRMMQQGQQIIHPNSGGMQ